MKPRTSEEEVKVMPLLYFECTHMLILLWIGCRVAVRKRSGLAACVATAIHNLSSPHSTAASDSLTASSAAWHYFPCLLLSLAFASTQQQPAAICSTYQLLPQCPVAHTATSLHSSVQCVPATPVAA
jgi:hypothetical protein